MYIKIYFLFHFVFLLKIRNYCKYMSLSCRVYVYEVISFSFSDFVICNETLR